MTESGWADPHLASLEKLLEEDSCRFRWDALFSSHVLSHCFLCVPWVSVSLCWWQHSHHVKVNLFCSSHFHTTRNHPSGETTVGIEQPAKAMARGGSDGRLGYICSSAATGGWQHCSRQGSFDTLVSLRLSAAAVLMCRSWIKVTSPSTVFQSLVTALLLHSSCPSIRTPRSACYSKDITGSSLEGVITVRGTVTWTGL